MLQCQQLDIDLLSITETVLIHSTLRTYDLYNKSNPLDTSGTEVISRSDLLFTSITYHHSGRIIYGKLDSIIIGVYAKSRTKHATHHKTLLDLAQILKYEHVPIIILGDINMYADQKDSTLPTPPSKKYHQFISSHQLMNI